MRNRYRSLRHATALALLALSCGDDPKPVGQLMVAIQTDMSIPKDVTDMRVRVLNSNGIPIHDVPYPIYPAEGTTGSKLPATVAIVAGENPTQSITIQVIAERKGRARTLREAVTQVPADRIAVLHMPIQWLCSDQVTMDSGKLLSECDPGFTCVSGECKPSAVDVRSLETYSEAQVFGGGSSAGDGQCFQTLECLDDPAAVTIQPVTQPNGDCTVDWPKDDPKLNLGLLLPAGGDGICNDASCYVPLDARTPNGWQVEGTAPLDDPGSGQADSGTAGVGGAPPGAGGTSSDVGAGGEIGSGGSRDAGLGGASPGGAGGAAPEAGDDFAQSRTQQSSEGGGRIRIKLPSVICGKLRRNGTEEPSVLALKASTSCTNVKSERTPTCGPWSVVGVPRSTAPCDLACDKLTLAGATCPGEDDQSAKDPLLCRRACKAMPISAPAPCGPAWQSYVDCVARTTYSCGESGVFSQLNCESLAESAAQSCGGGGSGGRAGTGGTGNIVPDAGEGGAAGIGGMGGRGTAGSSAGGSAPDASAGTGGGAQGDAGTAPIDCSRPSSECASCLCNGACADQTNGCMSDPGCAALFTCARQNGCPRATECAPCQSLVTMYPSAASPASALLQCASTNCSVCADGF